MKAYVMVTGAVFGLVTLAHVWRLFVEGRLLANPWFVAITVISASLSAWAGRLAWSKSRS